MRVVGARTGDRERPVVVGPETVTSLDEVKVLELQSVTPKPV